MGIQLIRIKRGHGVRLTAAEAALCVVSFAQGPFVQVASAQSPAPPVAAPGASVTVQQVTADIPAIRFYVAARSPQGEPLDALTKDNVRINAAGTLLPLDSLTPFRDTGEGVAYALLIDNSGTIKPAMPQIKNAALEWMQQVGPRDRIALVKVGSNRDMPEFVSDPSQLTQFLYGFDGNDNRTLLYDSIDRTLRSFATTQDLPRRKVIVVITDGKDDDDVTGMTYAKLSQEIDESGIPIFAIGVTPAHQPPRAIQTIKSLAQLAVGSHGVFIPLNGGVPGDVYEAFHKQILDVYDARATCPGCPYDGEKHSFQVMVQESRSDAMELRFNGHGIPWYRQSWIWVAAAASLLLLAALIWIVIAVSRRRAEPPPREPPPREPPPREPPPREVTREIVVVQDNRHGIDQLLAEQRRLHNDLQELAAKQNRPVPVPVPQPVPVPVPVPPPRRPPVQVILSVIRKRDETKVLELHERLTIGAAQDCDFCIVGDEIDDYECEIRRIGDHFALTNRDGSVRQMLPHESEFYVGSTKLRCLIG